MFKVLPCKALSGDITYILISYGLVCSPVSLLTEEIYAGSSMEESCQYLNVLSVYVHRYMC